MFLMSSTILGPGEIAVNLTDKVCPQAAPIQAEKTSHEPGDLSMFSECQVGSKVRVLEAESEGRSF